MSRLDQLQHMLDEEGEDPFLRYALAMEQQKVGRADQALETFARLQREHPAYVPTYYQFAQLLAAQDQSQQALAVIGEGVSQALDAGDDHAAGELRDLAETLA